MVLLRLVAGQWHRPPMDRAVLAGEELGVWRGGRLVFRGLGFQLGAGEMLTLEGPNGSGKSTLLRLVAGLLSPAAGRVLWGGEPVEPADQALRIAYIGHGDALKVGLTVAEALHLHQRIHGVPRDSSAALEAFGIAGLAKLPVRLLSAGQRRRVALARLLAVPKPIWLLDEPTTALDHAAVEAFAEVLKRHLAAGGRVMAATHLALGVAADRLSLEEFAP